MSTPERRDFEERYSACFTDFALKTVTGLLIGSMFGGFFLRGYRRWPMYIGGGLGFGMAYSNCEDSLNTFLLSKEPRPCIIKKKP
ncbi:PREDICTED: MICOS complex subunit Mic10-like [Papilio polytes]|uniref:MICOS complex subunit Mic10-like n=1 Tax=Papilio polytes TaxID=76194 RepID=UPI0006765057|nr:PREDICTED: MICOS complex subunit Mic10-like [Papilio polytes]